MSTKCELRARIASLKRQLREAEEQLYKLEMCEINNTLPFGDITVSRRPGKVCVTKTSQPFFIPGLGFVRKETEVCKRTDPLDEFIHLMNLR